MSSKTFLVNTYNKKFTEFTYNNIDNLPNTPEYRTFNNKSLIFKPNTDIDLKVRNFKGDHISGAYDPVLINNIDPANGMEMFDSDTQYSISFIQKHGCLTIKNQSGFLQQNYNSETERLFNHIKRLVFTDNDLLQTLTNGEYYNTMYYLLDIGCIMSSENLPISLNPYFSLDIYSVQNIEYNILELYLDNGSLICSKRDFHKDENGEKSDYIVDGINGICLIVLVLKNNGSTLYDSEIDSFLTKLEWVNQLKSLYESYPLKNQFPSLGSSKYSYDETYTNTLSYFSSSNVKINISSGKYTSPFDVYIDLSEIDTLPEFEGHYISTYKDNPAGLYNLYSLPNNGTAYLYRKNQIVVYHVSDYFSKINNVSNQSFKIKGPFPAVGSARNGATFKILSIAIDVEDKTNIYSKNNTHIEYYYAYGTTPQSIGAAKYNYYTGKQGWGIGFFYMYD